MKDRKETGQIFFTWLVLLAGVIVAFVLCTQTSTGFVISMFDTLGLSLLPDGTLSMDIHNFPVLTHWWGVVTFAVGFIWFFAFIVFTLVTLLLGIGTGIGLDKLGQTGEDE